MPAPSPATSPDGDTVTGGMCRHVAIPGEHSSMWCTDGMSAMPVFVIRDYEPADQETLVELNRYGLAAAGVPEAADIYSGDLDDIAGTYLNARGVMLVGEVDGVVVAMGGLWQIGAASCEILRMRVKPNHQGRGFARALLSALEDRARELGYQTAVLVTGAEQHPAIDLYRSAGYEKAEIESFGDLVGVRLTKGLGRATS